MGFDISGNVRVNISGGYARVEIARVDYDDNNANYDTTSGTVRFTLWATTTPYSGGTISGYRIVDYTPTNDTLHEDSYYYNVRFGDEVNIPDGRYYLTVTVSEHRYGTFYMQDYSSFSDLFTVGSGGGGTGGGGTGGGGTGGGGTGGGGTGGGGTGGGGSYPGAPVWGTIASETLYGTNSSENIYGRAGADYIWGYAGDDRIYGNSGWDTLLGGTGNDTLNGGNGRDVLSGYDGNDKVMGARGNDNVGGNGGHDRLYGNSGRDYLFGDVGSDFNGNDLLNGGRGADTLQGDGGADRFIFTSVYDAPVRGIYRETINDFSRFEGDQIALRAMDANVLQGGNQAFRFIGDDAFTGRAGQLRFKNENLMGDVNGDRVADFVIVVEDVSRLYASDIIL